VKLLDAHGKPIRRWLDWSPPKKRSQWRSGRSAMELARAWFLSPVPVMPHSLRRLLDGHPLTRGFQAESGYPEKITLLPERGEGRNHDLVLLGKARGRRVVVCIEAKVDEEFGPKVGAYYDAKLGTRSRAPQRIDTLCKLVFGGVASGARAPWRRLRYQLITSAAGSILEAADNDSLLAVFVVHEMLTDRADRRNKVPRNHADYEDFVRVLLRGRVSVAKVGKLYGPVVCQTGDGSKINLLVGKVVEDWGE